MTSQVRRSQPAQGTQRRHRTIRQGPIGGQGGVPHGGRRGARRDRAGQVRAQEHRLRPQGFQSQKGAGPSRQPHTDQERQEGLHLLLRHGHISHRLQRLLPLLLGAAPSRAHQVTLPTNPILITNFALT